MDPFRSSFRPVSLWAAVHEDGHCLMWASATFLDEQACLSKCQVFKINAVEKNNLCAVQYMSYSFESSYI